MNGENPLADVFGQMVPDLPPGLFPVLAGGAAGLALLGGLGLGYAKRRARRRKERLAVRKDLAKAGMVGGAAPILGRLGSEYVTAGEAVHSLVIGPTGCGKSTTSIIPSILAGDEQSLLINDPKGELYRLTAGHRARLGPVHRFDPSSSGSAAYNPLCSVRETGDAQRLAHAIAGAGAPGAKEDYWRQTAILWLTGFTCHLCLGGHGRQPTLGDLRDFPTDIKQACAFLRTSPSPAAARVGERIAGMIERESRALDAAASEIEAWLQLWDDERVQAATGRNDFDLSDLACDPCVTTIYLTTPPSEQARMAPLMRLLVTQALAALTRSEQHDARGRVKRREVLAVMDEMPSLGRIPEVETLLSLGRGFGVRGLLAAQSLKQINAAYGSDHAILDNCGAALIFPSNDPKSLSLISDMAGRFHERKKSRTRADFHVFGTSSTSEVVRAVLETGEVARLGRDHAYLITRTAKPAVVERIQSWRDTHCRPRLLPEPCLKDRVTQPVEVEVQAVVKPCETSAAPLKDGEGEKYKEIMV